MFIFLIFQTSFCFYLRIKTNPRCQLFFYFGSSKSIVQSFYLFLLIVFCLTSTPLLRSRERLDRERKWESDRRWFNQRKSARDSVWRSLRKYLIKNWLENNSTDARFGEIKKKKRPHELIFGIANESYRSIDLPTGFSFDLIDGIFVNYHLALARIQYFYLVQNQERQRKQ